MTSLDANSWNSRLSNRFYPFRYEIWMIRKILLRGTRPIIPKSLQVKVLELAHEGHPGESAIKRRLRVKVWWQRIDRDVQIF